MGYDSRMRYSTSAALRSVLETVLGAQAIPDPLDDGTPLIGAVPELDSMAVIGILTGIQETFGCTIADDEVGAETFESFGSLRRFVESKKS